MLTAGYLFFWLLSGQLLIFLLGTTLWTYAVGQWLSMLKMLSEFQARDTDKETAVRIKKSYKKKEKLVLAAGILALLAVLGWMKYYGFVVQNLNRLFGTGIQELKWVLPIGISFYTLQAIGYMADVYWDKIRSPLSLKKTALFLGFFPQIMEGPISMYPQTADDLSEGRPLTLENLSMGTVRITWGLFKKMIIADRLNVLVNALFDHYDQYSGVMIIVAAVSYTVQLYMEFSGSMDIIIGSGKMFGITLPENFMQPFFARSASEFWRRWHISLGAWFKTYIFYPVSMSKLVKRWNRFGRKHAGKHMTRVVASAIALLPVWLCNGLWHGPRWSYIFYGLYYFTILMLEVLLEPLKTKVHAALGVGEDSNAVRVLQTIRTWLIIFTGELFFRAISLKAGLSMFGSIFRNFSFQPLRDETLLRLGLDRADFMVIAAGCMIVFCAEILKERKMLDIQKLQNLWLPARWSIYYGLILSVIIFGAYGAGYQQVDLIYAGF